MKNVTLITGNIPSKLEGIDLSRTVMFPELGNREIFGYAYTSLLPAMEVVSKTYVCVYTFDGDNIISNSDHVFNALRVLQKDGAISLNVIFFNENGERHDLECVNGRFKRCPAGFFDEWDNQLDKLLD